MHPECSIYQGITLIEDEGNRTYGELTRLAFGVSIAPKVLRSVIDFILEEAGIDGGVEPYFDDLRVPKSQVDNVVKALNQNGFSLKEPEEAETSGILGLQRIPGNIWTRRSPLGPIQGETYHHLKSWVATLACSHYPVLRWLRPAARGLERIGHLENPSASKSLLLSQNILRKCEALHRDIFSRGDPATGKVTVDAGSTWRLYCDASDLSLGACLYFGSTYVEDVSWLRKLGDIRLIDVVELEAALKGLNTLVLSWRRTLGMTGRQSIEVYTDNRPVLEQLQRKLASHWHSSEGLTVGSAEARLQMIEDTFEVSGLSVSYHYVESERNPADHLTRLPTYLRWKKPSRRSPAPQLAAPAILADQEESWREASQANEDGLYIPDSHLIEFLTEVHNDHHEGSEGLFNRLRG
ncbi:hypothetical protein Pmar_PMAR023848 [Perkinsus marinus ATCC 50983]|uniref:RNase H type-1 domain-containing protein n=1 Tax=Perkinsus marinus (strain ATCC 50983 / TXsc) TaxID=423536 RepID=C5LVX5_PERM5|nr:hypothetical protein Pmar_PMAR023848 [Perkinsus marinus ATCC 50983]EEQ99126.1 hypothetical protein Pmar_PMAR023848 [Perkinsus marinus ATCC 50983]|eukprot:XP_002766409.1 hypothetical protein Pmar_PMAR023848 [Perkinsus marinus ATCC 50983]